MLYRQCLLSRSNLKMVSWIPSQFAKLGMILRIKERSTWQEGWKVEEVWSEQDDPPNHRDLITTFNLASKR